MNYSILGRLVFAATACTSVLPHACHGADGKGGNPSLSEGDVSAALTYMHARLGQ